MNNKSKTIELTKIERGFLQGIQQRHQMAMSFELNQAISDLLEGLGLKEMVDQGKVAINISPDYKTLTWTSLPQPPTEAPTGTPPSPAPPAPDQPAPETEQPRDEGPAASTR